MSSQDQQRPLGTQSIGARRRRNDRASITPSIIAFGLAAAAPSFLAAQDPAEAQRVAAILAEPRRLEEQGLVDAAVKATEDALTELATEFSEAHWSRAYALEDLARLELGRQRLDRALSLSREAQAVATSAFGAEHQRTAYFSATVAFLEYASGNCAAAQREYQAAYRVYRATSPAHAPEVAQSLANLLIVRGDLDAASAFVFEAFGEPGSSGLNTRGQLLMADLDMSRGRFASAQTTLDQLAVELRDDTATADSRTLLFEQAELAYAKAELDTADTYLDRIERTHNSGDHWDVLYQRGLIEGLRGRLPEAQALFNEVLDGYRRTLSDLAPPVAYANHSLAWVRRLMGDYGRSLLHFENALSGALACMGEQSALTAAVYMERSLLYQDIGRLQEALADATKAINIIESGFEALSGLRAFALATHAFALKRIGRYDDSRKAFNDALFVFSTTKGIDAPDMAPGYAALAEISLAEGRYAEARAMANRAVDIRRKSGAETFWGSGLPLSLLAAADGAEGRSDDYWATTSTLLELIERRLQIGPAASELVLRELRSSRELVERVLDAMPLVETGGVDERHASDVFSALQLPQLSDLSSIGAGFAAAVSSGNPQLAELLTNRKRLQEDLHAANARLERVAMQARSGQVVGDTERDFIVVRELENDLVEVGSRLSLQYPDVAALMAPKVERLEDVRRKIEPGDALYVQTVTEQAIHAMLLTREGAFVRTSPMGRNVLRRHVNTLRRSLDLATPLARRVPFDPALAFELYRHSIGAFENELRGKQELYVLLDDAMQSLPLSVLVVEPPPSSSIGAPKPVFLAEEFAITVLPSLSAYRPSTPSNASRDGTRQPFIGFGDPFLPSSSAGGSRSAASLTDSMATGTVLDELKSLSALPETAEELAKLAAALSAPADAIHTRDQATERAVKSTDLSSYGVISFATHGLMAGEFRGVAQPALVLSPPAQQSEIDDGLLTASEIVQLTLSADVVLLSACNTGRVEGAGNALGVSGLARAFMFAGARSVLVSHWAVSSRATVPLLIAAVQNMATQPGISKSRALQLAMISMLRGEAGEQYTEPAYWAPFVLVGENSPIRMN